MGDNNAIFAHNIAAHCEIEPDLDVLTFVNVDGQGQLADEKRNYQQLWDNGQRLARALLDTGLGSDDRFALLIENHPEFVDAMTASSIAGTVFVPIDPRTKGQKLDYMLRFAKCKGVLCADYSLANLLEVADALPQLEWIWVLKTGISTSLPTSRLPVKWLQDVIPKAIPELPIAVTDPEQTMQLLYTSGTTGDPKAIICPYSRYDGVASIGPAIGLNKNDRLYTGLSLTHANAQNITLGNILKMGLRGVISRKFTKSRLWDICRHYGCTVFNLLGGMTTAIYSEPEKPNDGDNPVRMVLSAGMPAAIWTDFKERFDLEIYELWGTAEGGVTLNPPGVGPIGSIGKAGPGTIAKIVDEAGNECPAGIQGELILGQEDGSSWPAVNYLKNNDASEKKTHGGFFRSGDICHKDDEGWLFFDYRMGGGIRHNGDFVNPAFVEKAIAEYDSVTDVFVYGVKAASGAPGEKDVVAAVVTPDSGTFSAQDLFCHCRATLEANFVPSFIQLMKEIPKTASEKPQERFCLEHFEQNPQAVYTEQR
jgi:crotonobetaine/carnitine-CoA ligase